MALSFAQKQAREKTYFFVMYQSVDEAGVPVYALLSLRADRVEGFDAAMKTQATLSLADYGKILASGFGAPPEDLPQQVHEAYGLPLEPLLEVMAPRGADV